MPLWRAKNLMATLSMADQSAPEVIEERRGRVSVMLILVRLLVCSFAFFVAMIAAGLIATFGLYRGLESDAAYAGIFAGTAIVAVLLAAKFALTPFAAIVVLAEAFAVRSMLVFAVAGLLIAVAFAWVEIGPEVTFDDRRLMIAAAAGIVGGFVYWLIAGRSSGAYRERLYRVSADQ